MALDIALFRWLNGLPQSSLSNAVWHFLTTIGWVGAVWLVFALTLLLGANRLPGLKGARWRAIGVAMLIALAITGIMELTVKPLFARPRPPLTLADVHVIGALPSSYSFPSGHALSSFAAATVLWAGARHNRADAWGALLLAALISFSRITTGHHYPIDVLVGAVAGMFIGRATWATMEAVLTARSRAAAR
jgi:undecaprenyl-diphosphatase